VTDTEASKALREAFDKYRTPDPSIVDQLPRGGTTLSYVGHAECTAVLITIDPLWSWEPRAWDEETGGPKVYQRGGHLMMWGYLTLLGKTMPCVGTAVAKKAEITDVEKELIGDLLRNGAMRFGIFVDLWAKDHPEADLPPERSVARPAVTQEGHGADSPRWLAVKERLLAMGDARKKVVNDLVEWNLFNEDRTPMLPYSPARMTRVEEMVSEAAGLMPVPAPAREARDDHDNDAVVPGPEIEDPSPAHAEHAVETILLALGVDEVPADVDPAFWYLADFKDADEVDWKAAARMLRTTQKAVLDDARKLATAMLKEQPNAAVRVPDRLDEIHGHLAIELRALLIKDAAGEPY
jgi:hypothetical protein